MRIRFSGASETVTGSKTYVKVEETSFLVDCGMYQGSEKLSKKNFEPFAFDIINLDYLFLTHGHLDHCGLIPKLFKDGFRGQVYTTEATKKVAKVIMLDCAKIHYNDHLKKKREGKKSELLYSEEDVLLSLSYFKTIKYNEEVKLSHLSFSFQQAGHILGASTLLIKTEGKKILFSGDIGRSHDPIEFAPEKIEGLDYLFTESTYGNRFHSELDPILEFKKYVESAIAKGGQILIPSFAVARTQLVLFYLNKLFQEYPEIKIPVYVDSPMGSEVTELYYELSRETRLSESELREIFSVAKFLEWEKEVKKIKNSSKPYILLSSSGMISGGKVLKHFDRMARLENNLILLVGYQAEGTIGRSILEGNNSIPLFGGKVPIRAEVELIGSLSAHADQKEILDFISSSKDNLKKVFLLHGEKSALEALSEVVEDKLNVKTHIAKENEDVEI